MEKLWPKLCYRREKRWYQPNCFENKQYKLINLVYKSFVFHLLIHQFSLCISKDLEDIPLIWLWLFNYKSCNGCIFLCMYWLVRPMASPIKISKKANEAENSFSSRPERKFVCADDRTIYHNLTDTIFAPQLESSPQLA